MDKTIVIIGAGPAGAMLAIRLASSNKKVLLYDHKAPWEKPCGGMLRPETIDNHPELESYPYPLNRCNGITYISTRNDRTLVPSDKAMLVISRVDLNRFLLDMAINSGTEFIHKKVLNISQDNSQWIIKTDEKEHQVHFIVGADGVNSIVRKATIGKIHKKHLSLTCGYFLTDIPEHQYIIKFLDIVGYIWVFSRDNHASVGIGAKLGTVSSKFLFNKLDDFLYENYPGFKIVKKYSAFIPTATDEIFFDEPCCGDNWLLVGDAAGHVDPIVGEGIYYSLESAEVAAQAILSEDIHSYDTLWRERYGNDLKQRASFRQTLSNIAQDFNAEVIGALMYDRAIGGLFFKGGV